MPLEPFPTIPFGEFTVLRPFTAPGLFVYRHMQANQLLHFPDLGGGDMNAEQRKDALTQMVNLQRPLAAVVLFLGVVALEDFIRDIGARLADVPMLDSHFPQITALRPVLRKDHKPYARPDKDPATLSDWMEVNALFQRAIGVAPIAATDLAKLHDLALIRHTVAHHAALIRPIDVSRFRHWEVQANTVINPPVEFVREVSMFLYRTGCSIEERLSDRLFSKILSGQPSDWYEKPCDLILALIETFNWFGKILTDDEPLLFPGTPDYEDELRKRNALSRQRLTQLCIDDLLKKHAVSPQPLNDAIPASRHNAPAL